MHSLIDIIIIYICCTLYILINNFNTQSIISILIALILGCLAYYFNNKYVSLITVGLFVLCTQLSPVYVFYLPLFLYLFKHLHSNRILQPYLIEMIFVILFVIIYLRYGFSSVFFH